MAIVSLASLFPLYFDARSPRLVDQIGSILAVVAKTTHAPLITEKNGVISVTGLVASGRRGAEYVVKITPNNSKWDIRITGAGAKTESARLEAAWHQVLTELRWDYDPTSKQLPLTRIPCSCCGATAYPPAISGARL